ncbi:class I SAM-dependent methyltransferase [Streptomyces sp. TRM72054]|uniref:class I SAM-dependent methyltransferase n=1 Tax=Streptomyces TaxID=1883 RepID=UPI0014885DF7|nr:MULTISPECIES: class I SAM-dependent methyltransferase [Streptomyces]MBX9397638.1 class I SAM-dependent methyltransferase [Streptomyces sp. TRM72054]
MSTIDDIGYGRQFSDWYDRVFPRDDAARLTAQRLAELHSAPGTASLELGVGTGRIAIALAALAGPVTGVDSSREMLDVLAREAESAGVAVTGVLGDIRRRTGEDTFGLVYCVCATLSMLLTTEEQRAAVTHAAARLAPGGRLVIETHNPDAVLELHDGHRRTSYFIPYPEPGTGLQTYSTLVPESGLWQVSHIWHEQDGTSRVGTEASRLTTPDEVDAYATAAGLSPVGRWADWAGTPWDARSAMVVSVYERAA